MTTATPLPSATRLPTLYLPHGGGPCFFMSWPPPMEHAWDGLERFLRGSLAALPSAPAAILLVSSHYECAVPTVTSAARPPLLFDYYGFPESTYITGLVYDAPGSPALAARVRALLSASGIASAEDAERGFDHGVFVPLLIAAPEARIPVVQLSLTSDLDPQRHLAIGRALEPLRDEGVAIVGSGMSYHNMSGLRDGRAPGGALFDRWLEQNVTAAPEERDAALREWARAPAARLAHPREEHLLPLLVCAGAAGADVGRRIFHEPIGGAPISAFRFG